MKQQRECRVRLVATELVECVREAGPALDSPDDAGAYLVEMIGKKDREHFVVLHLDVKNRVRQVMETVAIGHLTSALVHPREVFKGAILANAAAVALLHNHPSGDPEPSREDIDLTTRLTRAGELLGIPVLDHVVIAESGFRSITERGIS